LFAWTAAADRDWRALEVEDIGAWVKWLRTPEHARAVAVAVLPTVGPAVTMRTVSRKLAAVDSFFVFHARHDDSVRLCLTRWYPGGRRSFRPFLAHIQKGSRRREIRLRGEAKPLPQVVTRERVRQLLGACQAGSSAMMVV
jgi:integrase/recombinase XerD